MVKSLMFVQVQQPSLFPRSNSTAVRYDPDAPCLESEVCKYVQDGRTRASQLRLYQMADSNSKSETGQTGDKHGGALSSRVPVHPLRGLLVQNS